MIRRSTDALKAKSAFFRSFNDIDVYVEDKRPETRKLIAKLLSRAIDSNVRIDTVFPLGPRTEVISKCRQDQSVGGRPRVYIIDGDIDLCLQRPAPGLARLYRLPRYCIENYLLDEDAIVKALAYESVDHEEVGVRELLDFPEWLIRNQKPLRRLFTAYAVCHLLASRERTITYPVDSLVRDVPGVVDPLLVEDRILTLKNTCDEEFGKGKFDIHFDEITRRHQLKSDRDFLIHFVSAKHYLLRLLRERMKRVVKYTKPDGIMKLNFAETVRPLDLRDAIELGLKGLLSVTASNGISVASTENSEP